MDQHQAAQGKSSAAPVVTEMLVIPVAGRDSMLLNLSGAHGPFFTRNLVVLRDNAGHTGVGEVPGGERIRQTLEDARPLHRPTGGSMAGEAFTLRYMPAREDLNKLEVFRDRGHPQRKAVEECPPGALLVMDSRKDPRAASAGGILVGRLKARGVAGVVTDGGFRDSTEIATLGIAAYHQRPSAPTNPTLHQAIDINVPLGCGDAPVFPGDVVVGEADGVIVIPAQLAGEIAEEAAEMTAYEDFVTEKVAQGRSILGLYPPTDEKNLAEFAAWRDANGR